MRDLEDMTARERKLIHRNRFNQIARAIDIKAIAHRDVVGEEL